VIIPPSSLLIISLSKLSVVFCLQSNNFVTQPSQSAILIITYMTQFYNVFGNVLMFRFVLRRAFLSKFCTQVTYTVSKHLKLGGPVIHIA
jgi:ACR3 family arsenite efflux pump ArsB